MQPSRLKRQKAERRGHFGEFLAMAYLMAKGYRIRARRLKTPVGEIDIIVRRGPVLAFVEVKSRTKREDEEMALMAVNRRRISRAAQFYLMRNPSIIQLDLRFDVIFLAPMAWPRHVKGAFDAVE